MRTEYENYFRTDLTINDAGLSDALYRLGRLVAWENHGRRIPPVDPVAGEEAGAVPAQGS
jgi:hypothetical protein